jgi:hypothetical protein
MGWAGDARMVPMPRSHRRGGPSHRVATLLLEAKRRLVAADRDLHERRDREAALRGAGVVLALGVVAAVLAHFAPMVAGAIAAFRQAAPPWMQAALVGAPLLVLLAALGAMMLKAFRESRERLLDAHYEGHRLVGLAAGDGGLAYLRPPLPALAEALEQEEEALRARKVLVVNPHQAVQRWDRGDRGLGHLEQLGCNPAEDSYAAAVADKHALRADVAARLEEWRDLGPDFRHVHVMVGLGTELGRGHTGVSSLEVLAPEALGRFPRAMVVVDLMTRETTPPVLDAPAIAAAPAEFRRVIPTRPRAEGGA